MLKKRRSWTDGSVTVDYGTLYCFHTSFTAQLPFPQNMYVLNRYANYPNGNQEAWPFQLADLFLFHFSCNTSQGLVMKHTVLGHLDVAHSATGNWTLLSASNWSDTTTGWCYQQHIHSRGIKLQRGLFANAWFFCVSQPCCCWCNWNQHHVNETLHPPPLCLSKSGHSLVILYTGHQSFCCVWLRACVIQCVFTWTHTKKMQRHTITHTP